MVLLSAQGMDAPAIVKMAFTRGPEPGRDPQLQRDGFGSLYRNTSRPPAQVHLLQRRAIKEVAMGRPGDYGLSFSTWSLSKLTDLWSPRGWSMTSATRGFESCSARKAPPFSA
jgi:hypothetical protein